MDETKKGHHEVLRSPSVMAGARGSGLVSKHALSAFQAYYSLCLSQDGPPHVGGTSSSGLVCFPW